MSKQSFFLQRIEANPERENFQVLLWFRYYFESPLWKRIRQLPFYRNKGCCAGCGIGGVGCDFVHNKSYVRFGGREIPADLEALCSCCFPEERAMLRELRLAIVKIGRDSTWRLRRYEALMLHLHGLHW